MRPVPAFARFAGSRYGDRRLTKDAWTRRDKSAKRGPHRPPAPPSVFPGLGEDRKCNKASYDMSLPSDARTVACFSLHKRVDLRPSMHPTTRGSRKGHIMLSLAGLGRPRTRARPSAACRRPALRTVWDTHRWWVHRPGCQPRWRAAPWAFGGSHGWAKIPSNCRSLRDRRRLAGPRVR
jgi:hypothetical protein